MQNEQAENAEKKKPILRTFYVWAIVVVILIVGIGLWLPVKFSSLCIAQSGDASCNASSEFGARAHYVCHRSRR